MNEDQLYQKIFSMENKRSDAITGVKERQKLMTESLPDIINQNKDAYCLISEFEYLIAAQSEILKVKKYLEDIANRKKQ